MTSLLVTTEEAAKLLSVSPKVIRRLVHEGKLDAQRFGGQRGPFRIQRASIEKLAGIEPEAKPRRRKGEPRPLSNDELRNRSNLARMREGLKPLFENVPA